VIAEACRHDLRNFTTFGSIMTDVSVRAIAESLTHANPSTTLLADAHFIKANDLV
jgi:hypothetical protein